MRTCYALLVTLILAFLAPTLSFAQTYRPFPQSGAVWRESFSASECCPLTFYNKNYHIRQEKDTLISGLTYKLLSFAQWYTVQQASQQQPDVHSYSEGVIGAMREEDKRIYFYDFTQKKDTLAYDFHLQVGDTLPVSYINANRLQEKNYVAAIDSVLLGNNYHKRYGIAVGGTTNIYVYIIEGVGSTFGLIRPLVPPFESGSVLHCFTVNNTTVYKENTLSDCRLVTSVADISKEEMPSFQIFPNPSSGQFTIQTQSIFPESYICVRDILGRIVLQEKLKYPNQTINISNQSKGLYFVELYYNGNKSVQEVILQ